MKRWMPLVLLSIVFMVSHVHAQTITWSGPVSFSLKVISADDLDDDIKLINETLFFSGTMELYAEEQAGLVQKTGCYVRFLGVVNGVSSEFCLDDLAFVASDVGKSTSEKFYLIGTGSFSTTVEGTPVTGISYADAKGTLKEDKASGDPISASVSGKLGGGFEDRFVFSASFRSTLVPQITAP